MKKYILDFDEITKKDVSTAGGKGANLGEMTGAGIPVPNGAVLTAQAYDHFMEHNSVSVGCSAAEIRDAVRGGVMPGDMKDEIISLYRSMGSSARVAVRSSATAEDLADASFAGQQETYLNVIGEEELLKKIKDCYASLWGDRAVSYRRKQGYDKQKVSLAVVIQQMIESESAGVIFTKDPTGVSDDIVINASYGLGEAVVSGTVSPDEYRCDKEGNVTHKVIGSKEIRIVYSENGTQTVSVPENLRTAQVLSAEMIRSLVNEAINIELHYGQPMDIEWAISDGKIYILQARCITTIDSTESRTFTENDFAGLPTVRPAKGRMRENVLFNIEKLPKPYFPLDHDFGGNVGKQKQVILSEAGIDMNDSEPIDDNGISSFGIGGFRPNGNIFMIPGSIKMFKDDEHNISEAKRRYKECRQRLNDEMQRPRRNIGEAGEALRSMYELIGDIAYTRFRFAIFPQVLENIGIERKLGKLDKTLSSLDLMDGLSYVTADINREMAAIADTIRNNRTQLDDVMKMSYSEIVEKYPALGEMFGDFLKKYGCRCDLNCYCFVSRSWNDEPDRFLGTLRTLIRSENFHIPSKEEGMEKFRSLMKKMQRRLSNKEYAAFRKKVSAVRKYHHIREATQYLWESVFCFCRELLRECADMLGADYNDLLYLFADELWDVFAQGELSGKYIAVINKRKDKRPLAEAYWNRCIEISISSESSGITGVSGSSGKATGKVCIVRSPEEFDKLQQGEVLVCPCTDPEWTPLFTLASAVVVDTGGTLSHAAIVAREYGIPAVLAAGDATKKLKDGDIVIVDGTKGTVGTAG